MGRPPTTGRGPLTDRPETPHDLPHLTRPLALTRWGLVAERATRAFWPVWTVAFVILAPLMFGWQDRMSLEVFWGFVGLGGVGLAATVVWGLRQFNWPTTADAVARLDATLPGRPIAAVADTQAIGAGDPASQAVWAAHLARMRRATQGARPVAPDLRVSDRDPYGLRFTALLFFVVALLFGSVLRVGSVTDIARGGIGGTLATGPTWEGWIAPPAYTGRPMLYLNDLAPGPLAVPAGSAVTLRLYGEVGALSVAETVSGRTDDAVPVSETEQAFAVTTAGRIAIDGPNGAVWEILILPDAAPEVDLTAPITADAMGELSQPFGAADDYGIESGTAVIALDLAAVDRRYGLAADPRKIEPVTLDLPMPFGGDRADFEQVLVDNLSLHPLANMPVTLTLSVTDAAGQTGTSTTESIVLPGRRFFQPVARAIVEQRRDLMWSQTNTTRVVQVLRAVSYAPETLFGNQGSYLRLRTIIRRLDATRATGMTPEVEAEIVQALWDLALQLEEGTLADARARLERAQERLAEAMRNGASEAEIAELMQELREATQDYMQMLADQMEPGQDGTDQPQMSENEMELSGDELQALMDRIEELMQEGRMAEAQALMEQLNALLENMRITEGQPGSGGPQTPGQQSMEDLADTLREQQELSDEAFREMQEQGQQGQPGQQPGQQPGEQPGQGQQPGQQPGQQGQVQQPGQRQQPGQQGQGQQPGQQPGDQPGGAGEGEGQDGAGTGESLAERQQGLRDELARQRGALPGLPGDAGDAARRSLDQAEGAMDQAEQALRQGDNGRAIDQQAEAMDALRNGMRAIGEALAQNEQPQPGENQGAGEGPTGQVQPSRRDPLGRELGGAGQYGTDENLLQGEDVYRRAEELLGEIRRRSAEQSRPQVERDYLDRLLDRF
ncbi:TIGR02302 family protein [Loktanella fryxellensis]|uniref:TIGR02302 family protein n=1 Tax=Loktanella fryxellensis TaxID=245187 RepID=A0A1H8B1Y4_9RHOB|nr:DUF4175 domain-containing protein [Loktanella fryxellensis]SEM76114.1 TIGR02302 family protein [Loktanella fryxellensis]